jgi:hypothetical protein
MSEINTWSETAAAAERDGVVPKKPLVRDLAVGVTTARLRSRLLEEADNQDRLPWLRSAVSSSRIR